MSGRDANAGSGEEASTSASASQDPPPPASFGTANDEVQRILRVQRNYYTVLKVRKDTPLPEIRVNYFRLSRLVHPDKCSHASAKDASAVVNQAYDTLRTGVKKVIYDRYVNDMQSRDTRAPEGLSYAEWESQQAAVDIPPWMQRFLAVPGGACCLLLCAVPVGLVLVLVVTLVWVLVLLPVQLLLMCCCRARPPLPASALPAEELGPPPVEIDVDALQASAHAPTAAAPAPAPAAGPAGAAAAGPGTDGPPPVSLDVDALRASGRGAVGTLQHPEPTAGVAGITSGPPAVLAVPEPTTGGSGDCGAGARVVAASESQPPRELVSEAALHNSAPGRMAAEDPSQAAGTIALESSGMAGKGPAPGTPPVAAASQPTATPRPAPPQAAPAATGTTAHDKGMGASGMLQTAERDAAEHSKGAADKSPLI